MGVVSGGVAEAEPLGGGDPPEGLGTPETGIELLPGPALGTGTPDNAAEDDWEGDAPPDGEPILDETPEGAAPSVGLVVTEADPEADRDSEALPSLAEGSATERTSDDTAGLE